MYHHQRWSHLTGVEAVCDGKQTARRVLCNATDHEWTSEH